MVVGPRRCLTMKLTFVCWPSVGRFATTSMTDPTTQLTDAQWRLIEKLFPWKPPSVRGGRPQAPPRACLHGILWILKTGARWKDLPKHFPSYTTCWRRLRDWTRDGTFQRAWAMLLRKMDGLRRLDWRELLADGTFSPAKKGVPRWGRPRRAKVRRSCFARKGTVCRSPRW